MTGRRRISRRRAEPTLALINVVFLLLCFFIVAGTIAPAPPADLRLVRLSGQASPPPRDTVALGPDGTPLWPDGVTDAAGFVAALPPEPGGVARILPDRDAPAAALVALARALSAAGAGEVRLMAERGAEAP